jgi:hypothetical protein
VKEAQEEVESIREELDRKGVWYYGSGQTAPAWPDHTVAKQFNQQFKQPLCESCQAYRLDHTTISEDLNYVLNGTSSEAEFSNGIRDQGRPGKKLEDFHAMRQARDAGLSEEEVAALRFYTSHSFDAINVPLRDTNRTVAHPLSATTMNIANGIKKLRALDASTAAAVQEKILWRGFKDLNVDDAFETDGGTELAPMSTTADLAIAVQYATRRGQSDSSLMFRIVTDNNLQRGAYLKWLSMFPSEDEILFPPLTYVQPTGRREELLFDDFTMTVIEVKTTLP